MSRILKIMILVVLMFAHAVSDLKLTQMNFNISDSNSTTSLPKVGQSGPPSHGPTGMGFGYNSPPPSFPMEGGSSSGPPEHGGDLSEKQKTSQPKLPSAQLSSCSDPAPSDIQINTSECSDTSDMGVDQTGNNQRKKFLDDEEVELFQTHTILTIFIPSFYTLVFIISVPLNICAVLVIGWRIKPKNSAQIFMLNLASADLLFAAVLPFKIAYRFNGSNWIFGPAMCRLFTAVFYWNMTCSVLLIACMSVDRFFAVVYPVRSLSWRSPGKAVIVCVAMWVLSFAGSMPLLFHEQTFRLERWNITTCHDTLPTDLIKFYRMYYITNCCIFLFLPLIITAFSYTQVIVTLSKAQSGVSERKKRRAVVLASTVLVIFVICFTPTHCITIATLMNKGSVVNFKYAFPLFLCLGSLNCLLDPLVYYYGSSHFQKELSSILGCQKTTQPLSDPSMSTCQTALKSNRKEVSEINTLLIKTSSSQSNVV